MVCYIFQLNKPHTLYIAKKHKSNLVGKGETTNDRGRLQT